jgi:hypothetical protein
VPARRSSGNHGGNNFQWLPAPAHQILNSLRLLHPTKSSQRRHNLLAGGDVLSGFGDDFFDSDGHAASTVAFVGGFHEAEEFDCF